MIVIAAAGALLAAAAGLTLVGLRDQVVFFYAPSELAEKSKPGERVRIGGLVEEGSSARLANGDFAFRVTDGAGVVNVRYAGDPPDLFRENQGVVAEGVLGPSGVFKADRVLAKHDENYMPKEVAEALKKSGEWRGPTKAEGPGT
jgi:cytochrome c-type biogenesis protein CcmE